MKINLSATILRRSITKIFFPREANRSAKTAPVNPAPIITASNILSPPKFFAQTLPLPDENKFVRDNSPPLDDQKIFSPREANRSAKTAPIIIASNILSPSKFFAQAYSLRRGKSICIIGNKIHERTDAAMAEKISLRKQKKFRARQTILTAAAQQFKLHGFANTSIAGIMQAAGLGVGTFYNYFSSKEEVLLTLAKNLRARVEKSIAAAKKINQSSPELLEVCCVCTSKMIDENRFILPLFISASEHSDKPEQIPQSLSPGFRELFEEIILRGQEQGEFRADVPANIISEMIHSIYQTTAFSKLEISFQENIRLKIKILLDGIRTADKKFFRSGDR